MKKLFLAFVTLLSINLFSQTVKDVHSEKDGFNVKIHYTLENAPDNQVFHVKIYYSVNSQPYAAPIQKVSGDVNEVIGNGKKLATWDVLSELGELKGEVKFKVVAVPVRVIKNPTATSGSMKGEVISCVLNGNQLTITCMITNSGTTFQRYLGVEYLNVTDINGNKYGGAEISTISYNGRGTNFTYETNIKRKISFKFNIVDNEISELASFNIGNLLSFNKIPVTRL